MTRFWAVLTAALFGLLAVSARADQQLPPASIDAAGVFGFRGGPTLGTWLSNKYTATPDALTVAGPLTMGNTQAPVVLLYASQPASFIVGSTGGARISMQSLGGFAGPDTFRTQFAVETVSGSSAAIEETAAIIEMKGVTGYARPWVPSTGFGTGSQVKGSDGQIFVNAFACTSGTGPNPSGTTSGQTDGTGGCTWNYVGVGAGTGRSSLLLTTTLEGALAGDGWGMSVIMGLKPGAWPFGGGFGTTLELDLGNELRDCAPGVFNGCQMYGLFLNGQGTYRSTAGIFMGGGIGFHYGMLLGSTAASDVGILNNTVATQGYLDNGSHSVATYRDQSTTPKAISLEGTYSVSQIAGAGWSVDPSGRIAPLSVISSTVGAPGTGALSLGNNRGAALLLQDAGGTIANYLAIQPVPSGFGPTLSAIGTDANIPFNIYSKGTGAIALRGPVIAPNLVTTGTVAGAICIDAAGSVFKKAGANCY